MKKSDVVSHIFSHSPVKLHEFKAREKGLAFAPTNIALVKYWGKRDSELNLPVTSSLSVSLPDKGAMTSLALQNFPYDTVTLNKETLAAETPFVQRLSAFLDLFRQKKQWHLNIDITMNIPVAAGLASSACGFASIVAGLNDLFDWQLPRRHLSILARLGSGSAARSFWLGFVEWYAGVQADGMDSFAEPLSADWPDLCLGIVTVSDLPKTISSRAAMQQTVNTSVLYQSWPKKVAQDMVLMRQAIQTKNFSLLGGTSESNALNMHATMLACWPPVMYSLPETIAAIQKVWELRRNGLELYFTQDAGANLKLLFLKKDMAAVKEAFERVEIICPFEG